MDFRLSYRGALRATQRDPLPGSSQRAAQWQLKHAMRLDFHRQLKTLWESHPLLSEKSNEDGSILNKVRLANQYSVPPWSFVPLVTSNLQVFCGLEITLLRLDHPGSSVWSGDVDNRVKTLIDALEVPDKHSGYTSDIPHEPSIDPMYCLLEDDKLLTSVTIETDRLLYAPPGVDQSWVEAMIRVRVKPENVTLLNLGL